jgi:hypothetical protein
MVSRAVSQGRTRGSGNGSGKGKRAGPALRRCAAPLSTAAIASPAPAHTPNALVRVGRGQLTPRRPVADGQSQ